MTPLGLNVTWGATDWSAFILERLRTESALLRAGARYIPMTGKSMVVPRLLDDGSASWVDELEEIPSDAPDADTNHADGQEAGQRRDAVERVDR